MSDLLLFSLCDDLIMDKIISYVASDPISLDGFFQMGGRYKRMCQTYLYKSIWFDDKFILRSPDIDRSYRDNNQMTTNQRLASYVHQRDMLFSVPRVKCSYSHYRPEDTSFDHTKMKPYSVSIAGQPSIKAIMDKQTVERIEDTDTVYHPVPLPGAPQPNVAAVLPFQFIAPQQTLPPPEYTTYQEATYTFTKSKLDELIKKRDDDLYNWRNNTPKQQIIDPNDRLMDNIIM